MPRFRVMLGDSDTLSEQFHLHLHSVIWQMLLAKATHKSDAMQAKAKHGKKNGTPK